MTPQEIVQRLDEANEILRGIDLRGRRRNSVIYIEVKDVIDRLDVAAALIEDEHGGVTT